LTIQHLFANNVQNEQCEQNEVDGMKKGADSIGEVMLII